MRKSKMIYLAIIFLLTVTAAAAVHTVSASAITYSGICGENVEWYLNTETEVLVILGMGPMTDEFLSRINKNYIKTIIIEDGVTAICRDAFRSCPELTSVTIPGSVTSIGVSAFSDCTGLTNITIPGNVSSIGTRAFSGCTGLTNITIPDSVTSINDYLFSGCTGLISCTIPDSVTSIETYAFGGCTGLESITIHDRITSISSHAFWYCSGLKSITIPNSVTSIGYSAFRECTGLTDFYVGENNKNYSTKDGVLYNKTQTTLLSYPAGRTEPSFIIPNSVFTIGIDAFSFCAGLKNITIPGSITSIKSNVFNGCTGLTSITIPDSVTSIGSCAFLGCTGLTSIIIPDSVTSIDFFAFWFCTGLTGITIPNSVIYIGMNAFEDCPNLQTIFFNGTKGSWRSLLNNSKDFYDTSTSVNIVIQLFEITWSVNGIKTTEVYSLNEIPEFKGDTSKPTDSEYIYTFAGWNMDITAVTDDMIYVAKYDSIPIEPPANDSLTDDSTTTPGTDKVNNSCTSASETAPLAIISVCIIAAPILRRKKNI